MSENTQAEAVVVYLYLIEKQSVIEDESMELQKKLLVDICLEILFFSISMNLIIFNQIFFHIDHYSVLFGMASFMYRYI